MASAANTCVAWLLLGSYVVLLGVGGFGVWVTVNNFGVDEPLPPTPPVENTTTTTTTTTPDPYRYDENKQTPLRIYAKATWRYADNWRDPRLYVGVPCSVSVLVATCVLLAGLCSRKFFATTFSLYSLVALWAGNIWLACSYQSNLREVDQKYFHQTVGWVLGFQIGLLVLLLLQVLLSVWELRRQKADWPIINLSQLFTVDTLLLTARLTLAVYTLINVLDSQLMRGCYNDSDPNNGYYERTKIRYPLYLAIIALASALYGLVAVMETMGSYIFGSLCSGLTSFTCLLSTLCYGTVAVLSSQVVVKALLEPPFWVYPEVMNFGIATSVISFLHLVSCLFSPTAARTPPSIIKKVINALKSGDFSSVNYIGTSEPFVSAVGSLRKILRSELDGSSVRYNLGSALFCLISIVICLSTWDGPLYVSWGIIVMLCAYSAILTRTFPPAVMELYYCCPAGHSPYLQRVMNMVLENIVLFVGSMATLSLSWSEGHIFCAVVNNFFILFQCQIIRALMKAQAAQTSETKPLTEDEDKESGLQDEDECKNLPEALA